MTSESLPSMRDVPQSEKEDLLIRKLKACENVFDFSDGASDHAGKEAKRRDLIDIADYVSSTKVVFTEATVKPFMDMVCANIMRALPVGSSTDKHYDAEEDEPHLEPSWPHIQIVYELLRKFVTMSDAELARARVHITTRFVEGLVELFNSEDPREREYLKMILHRIYGKVMPLRGPIRRAIMNSFFRVVHEGQRHHGISELLEILGSIINGFSVPLKEEHKSLLRRGLVPLHTAHTMPAFHTQLSFCVTQFVQKEPGMASEVVRELVRHWPVTHTRKEVMFLNELEELLDLARPAEADSVVAVLFKRLAQCMESQHFQVAERVLYFWNNEYVVNLFAHYRQRLMPLVVGALHENVEGHWNPSVQSLSFHVQKLLRELDPDLYADSIRRYHTVGKRRRQENSDRLRRWRAIDSLAERRHRRRADNSVDESEKPSISHPFTDCSVTPASIAFPQNGKDRVDSITPEAAPDEATEAPPETTPAAVLETSPEVPSVTKVVQSEKSVGCTSERVGAERFSESERSSIFVRCGDTSGDTGEDSRGAGQESTVAAVGVNLSV